MKIAASPTSHEPGASESAHSLRIREEIELRCYALTAWRNTDPPFLISPLIAVQFVMRETLGPDEFQTAWSDFMTGYRHHFRAGGLRAANGFALQKLTELGRGSREQRTK